MKLVTDKFGLCKTSSTTASSNHHLNTQTNSVKTTSFFSTIHSSKSATSGALYLTMEDLDQQSIRNFRLSSQFVTCLLGLNLLYIMVSFLVQRHDLLNESITCKATNISLTYLLFFLTAAYMALTIRNLKIFSSPKDFKNIYVVRSKKSVFMLFIGMISINTVLAECTTFLCTNIQFPVYTLCMTVLVSHILILLANFKIANEIRKDCEFSIAMESEESESTSAANAHIKKSTEKFEGSFCIYRSSKRDQRKKWRGRRRGKRGRRNMKGYKEYDGKSVKLSDQKPTIINDQDIFENTDQDNHREQAIVAYKTRKSRNRKSNKHNIRGIRISFGPKTHSQDSISTQTSESPNQSRNSGLNEFYPGKQSIKIIHKDKNVNVSIEKDIESKNTMGNTKEFKFHENSKMLSDLNSQDMRKKEDSIRSSDSFEDLEEFELEIDDEFKPSDRNGFSFYATPTKRLDKEFRKVCNSASKQIGNWD